jgi:uncharacterized protein with PhoU and TrkA domain
MHDVGHCLFPRAGARALSGTFRNILLQCSLPIKIYPHLYTKIAIRRGHTLLFLPSTDASVPAAVLSVEGRKEVVQQLGHAPGCRTRCLNPGLLAYYTQLT